MSDDEVPNVEAFADAHADLHRVRLGEGVTKRHRKPRPRKCATCPETRPEEFRWSERYRCKACRRAYNARRKRELKIPPLPALDGPR